MWNSLLLINLYFLNQFLLEKVLKIQIFMHQSKVNNYQSESQASSIILMNHRTRLDWLFYFCILDRLKSLTNIKIILKNGLKNIPGPGWAMQTALFIFIKRKWESDQLILTNFLNYFKNIQKKTMVSLTYTILSKNLS